jgi:aspartate kinase
MLEMASSGSKVMQARSVEFAKKFGVVFEVRNSMNSNPGTIVQEENSAMESLVVRGVSIERNQARVTVSGITAPVAYTALILSALAKAEINVDMIVANTAHDGQARQSFTMNMSDLGAAQAALKAVLPQLGEAAKLETEAGLAKLSVVGVGMRSNPGVATTVFQTLADAGIQTGMIATSEIRITTTVEAADIEVAARVVHAAFNLDQVSA